MILQPVYLSPEKPREVAPAPVYRSSLASDAYTHLREKSYLTQKFDYFPRTDTHKKVYRCLVPPLWPPCPLSINLTRVTIGDCVGGV